MAKRMKRAELFGKLGFASSMFSALGGVGTVFLILPRWWFKENVIMMGSTRASLTMLAVVATVVLGCFGFWASLQGAADGEGKTKLLGWTGFWVGTVFAMMAIVLGLCFYCYKT